jgi:hypothetical protein
MGTPDAASRTLHAADGTALTMTGVNLDTTEQRAGPGRRSIS